MTPPLMLLAVCWAAPVPDPSSTSSATVEPELELAWTAPASCPDEAWVRERVIQLLRRPLGEAEASASLRVSARATEREGGWAVEVRIGTDARDRARTMTGPSCDTLAETVALLTAISLDPGVDPSAEPPPKSLTPTPPPKPAPPAEQAPPEPTPARPSEPEPPPTTVPPPPRVRVGLRVAGSGALGITPRAAPGVTGAVAILWPGARLVGRVDHWFAGSVRAPGGQGGARISMTTGGLRGCLVPTVEIVEFPVCAGIVAGVMRGDGEDLSVQVRARLPFVGADIGPGLHVVPRRLGGLVAFSLTVDLVVPIVRPGFSVDDLGEVSRVFPVVGRAGAGVEFRVPRVGKSE